MDRAVSSAGEHTLHTGGVIGSIPIPPTILVPHADVSLGYTQIRQTLGKAGSVNFDYRRHSNSMSLRFGEGSESAVQK